MSRAVPIAALASSRGITRGNADPCPNCGEPGNMIIDSRIRPAGERVRRRGCPNCDHRWSTIEILLGDFREFSNYRQQSSRFKAMDQQDQAMVGDLIRRLARP